MKVIANCLECNKSFETEQRYVNRGHGKFCSTSCAAKHGNRNKEGSGRITKCATCGKSLYRTLYRIGRTKRSFCDRKCKRDFEYNSKNRGSDYGKNRRAHLAKKNELINERGIICEFPDCDLELYNDRSVMDMHHFEDPLDHDKTLLLCPYHHRLADRGYVVISDGILLLENENV